ncbi:PASTA domain-containing protein [Streptomyces cylindrosporus]|uniref:PASTA domain-containing protein n=1 Tax=Streptomyces cylindrosporus TaxID=2927583 RepID=UPI0027E2943A|nr:PASTA domain-containing protein [Streptomyces cylindrosporus]
MKAVAAGVPSLAPFFDEGSGLGHDSPVRSQVVQGSLQQGDTPGLYGGTRKPNICDVKKLKAFLTDPRNHQKAQAWADALSITTAEIPGYLDRLTPVLLRHDTLVQNHDYKKGKAVPFNSLLQAGIAILVDEQGLPAVKCSCGNPLRPFTGDTNRISVKFDDGNKKWQGYRSSSVVAVRPAVRPMRQLALVDVDDSARGIDRPVGTTGSADKPFNAAKPRPVPVLAGTTFGDASRQLAAKGLAVGYTGRSLPPDDATVTASDPPAGTPLRFGQYVTLSVTGGTSPGSGSGGTSEGSSGATSTPPGTSSSGPSTKPPSSGSSGPSSPSSGSSGPSSGSSGPSSPSSPSSGGPSTSSAPPSSSSAPPPSSQKPPSSDPPTTVSAPPPPSDPVTSSAPPPPSDPVTSSAPVTTGAPPPETSSAPATSEPASSAPAASEPGSSGAAVGAIM